MNASTVELLRNSSFLQFLNDEQFESVLSQFSEESYDYADVIVEQGKDALLQA